MFVSFFPRPKIFFWSVALWATICIGLWYAAGAGWGQLFGLGAPGATGAPGSEEAVGSVAVFWSPAFLWFYLYFAIATLLFALFWQIYAPHPWARWSILGSALILFITYFQVQVSVALNAWYGPFYDLIQGAFAKTAVVTPEQYYGQLATVSGLLLVAIVVAVVNAFFVSHWIFRWRTAMNNYYVSHWEVLRKVEGASQRVQEDTMRFARTMEDLGVDLIRSVMILVAFLPILLTLSHHVTELPIVGAVPHALVFAAILWSAFGTGFLALVGIKLPGLEFKNQRVEAAYRKELVYGEDNADRARPPTLSELFGNVRRNYFRLYFNYMYFNVARYLYLQVDNIFPLILLGPTVIAGVITLGIFTQINNAFDKVRESFQYLVNSWSTIVSLLSVYKRLRTFERVIHGEAPPPPEVEDARPAVA